MTTNSSAAGNNPSDNNGASSRTVPESELVALKQSLEAKVNETETRLAASQATLEQERAGRKPVEVKAQQVDSLTAERDTLKKQLETTQAEHKQLLDQTLQTIRQRLVTEYHLPKEKVDSFSLDQARLFLDTLPAPTLVNPANYDLTGGGQGGDVTSLSAREKIRHGL